MFTLGSLPQQLGRHDALNYLVVLARIAGIRGVNVLNPVALSIANAFPEPKARARAVGIWGAVAGISLGTGPLIGGALRA